MAFLEDPRLRQRWNQITHDAEAATENAAAGIWSFKEHYLTPCLGYFNEQFDQCTTVCLGDREERLRKRRERDLARERAGFGFDFYDDWYDESEQSGSFFGSWGGEDWDRLLAGTGSQKKRPSMETTEQPRRTRGMSYGTRGSRRNPNDQDPTVIPRTQPLGFLSKLPWKLSGTLRYKPSAADLQDNPGQPDKADSPEAEPLLASDSDSDFGELIVPRQRSGTNGSGDTSDSFRSRNDLFPSDGEGDEDAVPLDDDITFDMVRKDDRSTKSSGTRSSKGKRPQFAGSRTVSRTTLNSTSSYESLALRRSSSSLPVRPTEAFPTLKDLQLEEEQAEEEEESNIAKQKDAAAQLAAAKGLALLKPETQSLAKPIIVAPDEEFPRLSKAVTTQDRPTTKQVSSVSEPKERLTQNEFVPARLPHFG